MTPTTLVIDGDILVWRVAVVAQDNIDFGDGIQSYPDEAKARGRLKGLVNKWKAMTKADNIVIALSAIHDGIGRRQGVYWRHDLLPSYKMHRPEKESKQPPLLLFDYVRKQIMKHYDTLIFERCEADDVMGIVATDDTKYGHYGDRVIVSIDKDMKQIPGLLWNPSHPELGIVSTDLDAADRLHFYQALIGDVTDNYKGCPGIGPTKAEKLLAQADAQDNEKSRNYNRWLMTQLAFAAKGLDVTEAVTQCCVSRILRAGDYDYETHAVKLWEPPSE